MTYSGLHPSWPVHSTNFFFHFLLVALSVSRSTLLGGGRRLAGPHRQIVVNTMGLDLLRFKDGKVDEELICPICSGVLEAPVQAPLCEHTFCYGCIREWLSRGRQNCPVDRQEFTLGQLKPAPRILKNFLSRRVVVRIPTDFFSEQSWRNRIFIWRSSFVSGWRSNANTPTVVAVPW